jgi:hypothetical protein
MKLGYTLVILLTLLVACAVKNPQFIAKQIDLYLSELEADQ